MNNNISISEVKLGIIKCLENARALLEDSKCLLDNNRYSRSYTLAQLSFEETGKAFMLYELYVTIQSGKREDFDFKKFRKNFFDHKWKTFEASMVNFMVFSEQKKQKKDFKIFALENFRDLQEVKNGTYDRLKNDSLYVTAPSGIFKKPSETFEENFVRDFYKKIEIKTDAGSNFIMKWIVLDDQLGLDEEGIIDKLK